MLPEDLQNYETRMVIMGTNVVSLYPSLDIEQVGARVKEAILKSNINWERVDYLEGVRCIVLKWTQEECRGSRLRRVLPWRRSTRGTRP